MAIDGYTLATQLYEDTCRVALAGNAAAYKANLAMVVTDDLDKLESICDDLDVFAKQTHDFVNSLQKVRLWIASEREEQVRNP